VKARAEEVAPRSPERDAAMAELSDDAAELRATADAKQVTTGFRCVMGLVQ
jgi:hypothetical protein